MLSRFCPYTFTPTSVLIPVESILIRLIIGCVQPLVTPGICSLLLSSLMMLSFETPFLHSLRGFNITIVSIILIGELSVAEFTLPALPSTDFTSGSLARILSWTCKILFTSALETSGKVTGIKRMLPSSNGGINSVPRLITIGTLAASAIIITVIVILRHLMQVLMRGWYTFSKKRLIGFARADLNLPCIKKDSKTGASVITKMASIAMMKVLVYARG